MPCMDMAKLHENMSREAFENGYFYAADLRRFAKSLGIAVGNLKKDEIELHIKARLFGYSGVLPVAVPNRRDNTSRDLLRLDSRVVNYVDDRKTKGFLLKRVESKYGPLPDKSGQWYGLNSWRKAQLAKQERITYADLVEQLASLKRRKGRLPQIPAARLNNFISDFIADPENAGKGREQALEAWNELKQSNSHKTYIAYKKARQQQR